MVVGVPGLRFLFSAIHMDGDGVKRSCPACAQIRLQAEIAELRKRPTVEWSHAKQARAEAPK